MLENAWPSNDQRRHRVEHTVGNFIRMTAFSLLAVCLTACGRPPSASELTRQFQTHKAEFAKLRNMVTSDLGSRQYLAVGHEHVGDFWLIGGQWRKNPGEQAVSLSQVLRAAGISRLRYRTYMNELHAVGAQRVIAHLTPTKKKTVKFLVFASGLAVSGCGATIKYRPGGPSHREIAASQAGDASYKVTVLGDGWYAVAECT